MPEVTAGPLVLGSRVRHVAIPCLHDTDRMLEVKWKGRRRLSRNLSQVRAILSPPLPQF